MNKATNANALQLLQLSKKSFEENRKQNPSLTIMTTTMKTMATEIDPFSDLCFKFDLPYNIFAFCWDSFAVRFILAWEARRCRSSSFSYHRLVISTYRQKLRRLQEALQEFHDAIPFNFLFIM
jgi:hypothetical protein